MIGLALIAFLVVYLVNPGFLDNIVDSTFGLVKGTGKFFKNTLFTTG